MAERLAGKVALVTGASGGQGAAEARAMAAEGARVIACDVLDAAGQAVAADIMAAGGVAEYRHLDVASEDEWRATAAYVARTYGGLHVLVNNAGIAHRAASLVTTELADWRRVLGVNLTGPFLGVRATAELMRDSGGGSIVNTGSIAAVMGHFATAYSASKWGLRGLTKSAAMELAPWQIRVNAVHPGIVDTAIIAGSDDFREAMEWMTPQARVASPEEIASVVVFLASDEASFITGIDVPVDGGFSEAGAYRRVLLRVQKSADGRM